MKTSKVELKKERKKFDKFLYRDHERLGYTFEMLKTRKIVMQTYEDEVKRLQTKLKEKNM